MVTQIIDKITGFSMFNILTAMKGSTLDLYKPVAKTVIDKFWRFSCLTFRSDANKDYCQK